LKSQVLNSDRHDKAGFNAALSQPGSSFQVVDDVNEADTILYLDSNYDKNASDIAGYRKLLQWAVEHYKTIFSLSFEDRPLTALPGIYTSANPRSFDPSLHFSWPHLESPNDQVENAALVDTALKQGEQAKYLFSFAGSCSHPLRRKLFAFVGSTIPNKSISNTLMIFSTVVSCFAPVVLPPIRTGS